LLSLVIAFQFFTIDTTYSAGNISVGSSGQHDNYLSFSICYVSGS